MTTQASRPGPVTNRLDGRPPRTPWSPPLLTMAILETAREADISLALALALGSGQIMCSLQPTSESLTAKTASHSVETYW